jgi:hypothetical protein
MNVKKVRGKNKIIATISDVEIKIATKLGLTIQMYVKEYIDAVAKKRKWKWYFDKTKREKA